MNPLEEIEKTYGTETALHAAQLMLCNLRLQKAVASNPKLRQEAKEALKRRKRNDAGFPSGGSHRQALLQRSSKS